MIRILSKLEGEASPSLRWLRLCRRPFPPTNMYCYFSTLLVTLGELLSHVGEILGHAEGNFGPLGKQIFKKELIERTLVLASIYHTL